MTIYKDIVSLLSLTSCEADKLKNDLQQSEKRQKQLRARHQDRS